MGSRLLLLLLLAAAPARGDTVALSAWHGAVGPSEVPGGVSVRDDQTDRVVSVLARQHLAVPPGQPISLAFRVRTERSGQPFTAALAFYDRRGRWLRGGQNLDLAGVGEPDWTRWRVTYRQIPQDAASVELLLAPTMWKDEAEGWAEFADVSLGFGEPDRPPVGGAVGEVGGVAVWHQPPERRVRPGDEPPEQSDALELAALRGEAEAVQIGMRGEGSLTGLVIAPGPLAEHLQVRVAELVTIERRSDPLGRLGPTPDPLVPLSLPLPLDGDARALWLTAEVPPDFPAGDHAFALTLRLNGESLEVPGVLHVADATLPRSPTLASAVQVPAHLVARGHGTEGDPVASAAAYDQHLAELVRARLNPTDPLEFAPLEFRHEGWPWRGGQRLELDGNHALQVPQGSWAGASDAAPLRSGESVSARFRARARSVGTKYRVRLEGRDAWDRVLHRVDAVWTESEAWRERTLEVSGERWPQGTAAVVLQWQTYGGDLLVDDLSWQAGGEELVADGGFEAPPEGGVVVRGHRFAALARHWLDEVGLRSFRLAVPGLAGGRREHRRAGALFGHDAGTAAYDALARRLAEAAQVWLEARGWGGRAYFYEHDEPLPPVREHVGSDLAPLQAGAPSIGRLVTLPPQEDLHGAVDRWVPVVTHLHAEHVAEAHVYDEQIWTYVCCCMQWPSPSLMIDHEAMAARALPLMAHELGLDGLLYWSSGHWLDARGGLADPYQRPFVTLPDGTPAGNGDGRLLYPPPRAGQPPVRSIRLEMLRESMEDVDRRSVLARLVQLRAAQGYDVSEARLALELDGVVDGRSWWTDDPSVLHRWRRRLLDHIDELVALEPAGLDSLGIAPRPAPGPPPRPEGAVPLHERLPRASMAAEQQASRQQAERVEARELARARFERRRAAYTVRTSGEASVGEEPEEEGGRWLIPR